MKHLKNLLVLLPLVACAPRGAPPNSPGNDIQPPTTNTGDGEMMGADRVPPGQKLEEGPKLDTQGGLKPAAQPPAE